MLDKTKYYTVKDTVLKFKATLREIDIHYKLLHLSPSGSCYLEVTYKKEKFVIRFSDHHENNRKLPDFNVLVRYPIEKGTISNSGKRYYNEFQLDDLIQDLKKEGKRKYELKRLGKKRNRISEADGTYRCQSSSE